MHNHAQTCDNDNAADHEGEKETFRARAWKLNFIIFLMVFFEIQLNIYDCEFLMRNSWPQQSNGCDFKFRKTFLFIHLILNRFCKQKLFNFEQL